MNVTKDALKELDRIVARLADQNKCSQLVAAYKTLERSDEK